MIKSESIKEISQAFVKFQSEQDTIPFNCKNKFFTSEYADLTALKEGTRENLKNNNLAVSQLLTNCGIETLLIHSSGEYWGDTFKIESVIQKGINSAQAMGISITYARRYAYASILGLVTDQDVDGGDPNIDAGKKEKINQPTEIQATADIKEMKVKIEKYFNTLIDPTKSQGLKWLKTASDQGIIDTYIRDKKAIENI